MPKLILTRPRVQSEALAKRLRAQHQSEVVQLPLLEIAPLADDTALRASVERLEQYALVAFVSPNAINAFVPLVKVWPADIVLAVMGEGSRQALAELGVDEHTHDIVRPLDPDRTDSETLLAALDVERLKGRRALIVRGESGREFLADGLRAAGVEVDQIAAYRRLFPSMSPTFKADLEALLSTPNVWVVTSSEALRWLVTQAAVCRPQDHVAKLQQQTWLVPHPRIAETAQSLGLNNVKSTTSGDESLVEALQFYP